MGMFDNFYFNPQSFQGGGGLLGMLEGLQRQSSYQPSQGFANMQAQPIAVGDYMMPRIGSEQAFTPDPAAIPMAAQPAQGQGMPIPAPMQQEPSFGDKLSAGFQSWAQTPLGNPWAALANGMQGFSSGRTANPAAYTIAALEQAGIPRGTAIAAVQSGNPELLKFVMEKYGKDKFAFSTLPDGTVVRQDPKTGAVSPAYQGGAKPQWGVVRKDADGNDVYGQITVGATGPKINEYAPASASPRRETVEGPDGKQIPIPEGVDRKAFIKKMTEIRADVLGGKMTEVQAKSAKFGNQMELAENNLTGLDDQFAGSFEGSLARMTEGSPWLPGSASIGRMAQTNEYQKYIQARNSFITALLRDESGAAIGTDEFNRRELEMFPQPGDGPDVIAQKRELRRVAIEGMKTAAGAGYKSPAMPAAADKKASSDPLGLR